MEHNKFQKEYGTLVQVRMTGMKAYTASLESADLSTGEISKAAVLKKWLANWAKRDPKLKKGVDKDLNEESWEDVVYYFEDEQQDPPPLPTPAATTPPATSGAHANYKVNMRTIPKIPKNKDVIGTVFNEWRKSFEAAMAQAKVAELLELS